MLSFGGVGCLNDFGEVGVPIFLWGLVMMEMKYFRLHLYEIVVKQGFIMCGLLG